ncbi:MAG: LytTR family DNA-binding domain-containing protein [Bacteroidota bacterium]
MKIIIIEDESLLVEELADIIRGIDTQIQIIKTLSSVQESLTYLATHDMPDLFFSDIQLPDGLSFDIFRQINLQVPVVFCTAYDQYALDAFKFNGIDYVLKPFNATEIARTLDKYHTFFQQDSLNAIDYSQLLQLVETYPQKGSGTLLIHQGETILPIKIRQVAIVALENGITYLYTFDLKRYPISYTIETLKNMLGSRFFRVNRQYLISRDAVLEVKHYFARKLLIIPTLSFEGKLLVSKARSTDFLDWLQSE